MLCFPYIIIRMWQRLFTLFTIQCLGSFLIPSFTSKNYPVLMGRKLITLLPDLCVLIASGWVQLGFKPLGLCCNALLVNSNINNAGILRA